MELGTVCAPPLPSLTSVPVPGSVKSPEEFLISVCKIQINVNLETIRSWQKKQTLFYEDLNLWSFENKTKSQALVFWPDVISLNLTCSPASTCDVLSQIGRFQQLTTFKTVQNLRKINRFKNIHINTYRKPILMVTCAYTTITMGCNIVHKVQSIYNIFGL